MRSLGVAEERVRHKAGVMKGPQEIIEHREILSIYTVHMNTSPRFPLALDQLADEDIVLTARLWRQHMEIDVRHFGVGPSIAERARMYSISSGTGRPVEPLALPPVHAVPAMSRCAQRYSLV